MRKILKSMRKKAQKEAHNNTLLAQQNDELLQILQQLDLKMRDREGIEQKSQELLAFQENIKGIVGLEGPEQVLSFINELKGEVKSLKINKKELEIKVVELDRGLQGLKEIVQVVVDALSTLNKAMREQENGASFIDVQSIWDELKDETHSDAIKELIGQLELLTQGIIEEESFLTGQEMYFGERHRMLSEDLDAKKVVMSTLELRVVELEGILRRQNEELEALEALRAENETMVGELERKEVMVWGVEEKNKVLEEKIGALEGVIRECEETIKAQEDRLEAEGREMEALREEINVRMEVLGDEKLKRAEDLEVERELRMNLEEEGERMRAEIEVLRSEIEGFGVMSVENVGKDEEISAKRVLIEFLEGKNKALEGKIYDLEAGREGLSARINEYESRGIRENIVSEELEALRRETEVISEELSGKRLRTEFLEGKTKALEGKVHELEAERERYMQSIGIMETQRRDEVTLSRVSTRNEVLANVKLLVEKIIWNPYEGLVTNATDAPLHEIEKKVQEHIRMEKDHVKGLKGMLDGYKMMQVLLSAEIERLSVLNYELVMDAEGTRREFRVSNPVSNDRGSLQVRFTGWNVWLTGFLL